MQPLSTTGKALAVPGVLHRRRDYRRAITIFLFLLPAAIVYSLFVLFPLVQAAYYGLYKWNGLGPLETYAGLDNFRKVYHDDVFRRAVQHNFVILGLSICVQLPIAIGLALLVGRRMRARAFFRTVFFLPYVLSEVVTGVVWTFLYQPETGVNTILNKIIPGFEPKGWLGEPEYVLVALFVVITWKFIGFHIILYLAGLQNIPQELEEAAQIDGGGRWDLFRAITLPLLSPTIYFLTLYSVIGTFKAFNHIYVLRTAAARGTADTASVVIFQSIRENVRYGYASALAILLLLIILVLTAVNNRLARERVFYG